MSFCGIMIPWWLRLSLLMADFHKESAPSKEKSHPLSSSLPLLRVPSVLDRNRAPVSGPGQLALRFNSDPPHSVVLEPVASLTWWGPLTLSHPDLHQCMSTWPCLAPGWQIQRPHLWPIASTTSSVTLIIFLFSHLQLVSRWSFQLSTRLQFEFCDLFFLFVPERTALESQLFMNSCVPLS